MSTKTLIAAAALSLLGSAAFAQTNYTEEAMFRADPASTVTRSEVRAEFLRAKATGQLPVASDSAPAVAQAPVSTRSRADVRAEAIAFTKSGMAARVQAGY
jgi:hypothetical protein